MDQYPEFMHQCLAILYWFLCFAAFLLSHTEFMTDFVKYSSSEIRLLLWLFGFVNLVFPVWLLTLCNWLSFNGTSRFYCCVIYIKSLTIHYTCLVLSGNFRGSTVDTAMVKVSDLLQTIGLGCWFPLSFIWPQQPFPPLKG